MARGKLYELLSSRLGKPKCWSLARLRTAVVASLICLPGCASPEVPDSPNASVQAYMIIPSGSLVDLPALKDGLVPATDEVRNSLAIKLPPTSEDTRKEQFSAVIERLGGRRVLIVSPEAVKDAFGDIKYGDELRYWPSDRELTVGDVVEGVVNTEYEAGDPKTGLQPSDAKDLRDGSVAMVPVAIITRDYIIVVPLPMPKKTER